LNRNWPQRPADKAGRHDVGVVSFPTVGEVQMPREGIANHRWAFHILAGDVDPHKINIAGIVRGDRHGKQS
jgi:hypothetical protein